MEALFACFDFSQFVKRYSFLNWLQERFSDMDFPRFPCYYQKLFWLLFCALFAFYYWLLFCSLITFQYSGQPDKKVFEQPNLKFLIGFLFSEFSISV